MTSTDTALASVLDRIVTTTPLDRHDGRSGARIERAVLDDGTRVVVKRVRRADDLVMLATDDRTGREAELWSRGILDRLPPGVGHAVLAAGWVGDELVTCMRDLTGQVFRWKDLLTVDALRRAFAALATVHGAFLGDPPTGLCPLPTRLSLLTRERIRPLADRPNPLPAFVLRGWEHFADRVPADVAEEVFAAHRDPARIARGLSRAPATLLHGDFTQVNLALRANDVVLLDWSLATGGPAVLDFVCYLANCASRVDLPLDAQLGEVRAVCGCSHDENTLHAALFWGLAEMGWNKALDAAEHPNPARQAAGRLELTWWTNRAREALDAGVIG